VSAVPPPAAPLPTAPSGAERAKGYKAWGGTRGAQRFPWWVIAKGNLQLAWANRWVKAVLILSLVPGVIAAGVIYFFLPLSTRILIMVLQAGVVFVFLLAALVGARLISEDRRQGAFIAHFARPVTRRDYLVGKLLALALPVFAVSTLSGLLAVAADQSVSNETLADRLGSAAARSDVFDGYLAHVPPGQAVQAILAFGLIAVVTTTGLVLGVSALTTSTRTAGLAWFAIVALGGAAKNVLEPATRAQWPALLSWYDAMTDLAAWAAGQAPGPQLEFVPWPRLLLLVALSIVGVAFVDWRLRVAEGGAR
jgi:hypothetical protein